MSHWFNRILVDDVDLDVDLTGDQFGHDLIQIGAPGELYADTGLRSEAELNSETISRAIKLADRAGLTDIVRKLQEARL